MLIGSGANLQKKSYIVRILKYVHFNNILNVFSSNITEFNVNKYKRFEGFVICRMLWFDSGGCHFIIINPFDINQNPKRQLPVFSSVSHNAYIVFIS
jgi:hypothetical protein